MDLHIKLYNAQSFIVNYITQQPLKNTIKSFQSRLNHSSKQIFLILFPNQKIQQHYPSSLVTGALPIFRLACCLIFFRLSPLLYSNTSLFLKLNFILFELFMSTFTSHYSSSGVSGFFQSHGSFFRHPFIDVQLFELGKPFSLLLFKSIPYQALHIFSTDTLIRLHFPIGLTFSFSSLLSPTSSSRLSISPCETMRTWTFLVSVSNCTFLLERKMLRLIMAWKKYYNWQNIIQKNFCWGNQIRKEGSARKGRNQQERQSGVGGVCHQNTENWLLIFFNHATNPIYNCCYINATFCETTTIQLCNSLASPEYFKPAVHFGRQRM